MTHIVVTPLTPGDAGRCAEIERVVFTDESPWPAEAFTSEIGSPHNRYLGVRDDDGRVIAYAGISLLGHAGSYESEIHTIATDPDHRGVGLGRALMAALMAVADDHEAEVFLEVRTDNDVAIDMYRRNGFEQIGLRRRYYQPSGADAYTMRRARRESSTETSEVPS